MIFEAANDLGLTTHEYMWIFTRSVITSQLYSNFRYKNFPIVRTKSDITIYVFIKIA
jgi:hypothetical protein